jgi:hypothetical protein
MQKNFHELEKIIVKNFGKKCKDYNPFCNCCIMWQAYDTIKEGLDFRESKPCKK